MVSKLGVRPFRNFRSPKTKNRERAKKEPKLFSLQSKQLLERKRMRASVSCVYQESRFFNVQQKFSHVH